MDENQTHVNRSVFAPVFWAVLLAMMVAPALWYGIIYVFGVGIMQARAVAP